MTKLSDQWSQGKVTLLSREMDKEKKSVCGKVCAVQCSAVQCSVVQCSAVQCTTLQQDHRDWSSDGSSDGRESLPGSDYPVAASPGPDIPQTISWYVTQISRCVAQISPNICDFCLTLWHGAAPDLTDLARRSPRAGNGRSGGDSLPGQGLDKMVITMITGHRKF